MLSRKLLVVADDYGIGPEVSRGILELMQVGVVTSTVLLVNSPFVEQGVQRWKLSGRPGEMGWHPNLTMDEPIAKPGRIRSLLDRHGKFAPLGTLALRMLVGHLKHHELVCELEAQLERYYDLIGRPPDLINGHKHVHAFPMVNRALLEVLKKWRIRPYVRRVVEPQASWLGVPGARLKRAFLTFIGRLAARKQKQAGLPGNDGLAGITDPKWVEDSGFYARWLERTPGRIVELMVHPGHYDETLIGRDCSTMDGQLERRVAELKMLMAPTFLDSCRQAGFRLAPANPANTKRAEGFRDAA